MQVLNEIVRRIGFSNPEKISKPTLEEYLSKFEREVIQEHSNWPLRVDFTIFSSFAASLGLNFQQEALPFYKLLRNEEVIKSVSRSVVNKRRSYDVPALTPDMCRAIAVLTCVRAENKDKTLEDIVLTGRELVGPGQIADEIHDPSEDTKDIVPKPVFDYKTEEKTENTQESDDQGENNSGFPKTLSEVIPKLTEVQLKGLENISTIKLQEVYYSLPKNSDTTSYETLSFVKIPFSLHEVKMLTFIALVDLNAPELYYDVLCDLTYGQFRTIIKICTKRMKTAGVENTRPLYEIAKTSIEEFEKNGGSVKTIEEIFRERCFQYGTRVIKGIESQGMILAADVNGEPVLISPDKEIPPGSKVK